MSFTASFKAQGLQLCSWILMYPLSPYWSDLLCKCSQTLQGVPGTQRQPKAGISFFQVLSDLHCFQLDLWATVEVRVKLSVDEQFKNEWYSTRGTENYLFKQPNWIAWNLTETAAWCSRENMWLGKMRAHLSYCESLWNSTVLCIVILNTCFHEGCV